MNHLNQEPLDFAAAMSLLRACRSKLVEAQRVRDNAQKNHAATLEELDATLALLRELNDALVIPKDFQPRVDAVLDRAGGEGKPAVGSEANALRAELECYRKALNRIIADGECDAVQVAHEAITPYVPWQKVSPEESARLDAAVGIKQPPQGERK